MRNAILYFFIVLIVDIVKESFNRIGVDYTMEGIPFNRGQLQW